MKHKKVVILISGKSGAGKSEFAKCLEKEIISFNHSCVRLAFADDLKDIAYDHFSWDGKKDKKGRRLLQSLGTVGRDYNVDLWADKAKRKILEHIPLRGIAYYVIDDCRYLNEITFMDGIEDVTCVKVLITRPNNPNALTGERAAHSSENGLNKYYDYDYAFINVGENTYALETYAHEVVADLEAELNPDEWF